MKFDIETDYCVLGAGAAGCIVADRLSESGRDRVMLLEAGGRDSHPFIHIPATFLRLIYNPKWSWCVPIGPDAGLNGRTQVAPQGKVLGGGSSINGMVYMRGQPAEHDEWARQGCTGWGYQDVLPFYKMLETYRGGGDDRYRGRSGPIVVSGANEVHLLTRSFVAAARELGFPANDDFNGPVREGAGVVQNNRNGRFRSGTAQTYLVRAKKRANLSVETNALARKILFEGKRAIGVEFSRGGQVLRVRAHREVIVSCGALKSPHLLQLSGVGPASTLQAAGIPVLHDLPGVGEDLRDHLYVRISHRVKNTLSMNERTRGWRLMVELAKYAFAGSGIMANAATSGALFFRSSPDVPAPDLYMAFMPGTFGAPLQLEREPGMSAGVLISHPESAGSVRAKSPAPEMLPAVSPNYLSTERDCRVMVAGLREVRRIFTAPSLARWSAFETNPGPAAATDEALLEHARNTGNSGLHYSTSCRMGVDDRAVVTPELKVRGLEALRVIDASIMPGCTSGNTQVPVLMVAEKGSAMIRAERN
jgi:choline dehydrogenase